MTSLSRLEELLKDSGTEVLEILQLICTVTKYGARARLARDHIAPFVALGETSLDPEKYQSIRGRVEKDIDLLLSRQFISLEPELRCLLTPVEDSQLEGIVKERSTNPLYSIGPARYLLSILLPAALDRKARLSSTDDSLKNIGGSIGPRTWGLFVKLTIRPMVFTALLEANNDAEVEILKESITQGLTTLSTLRIVSIRMTSIPTQSLSLFPLSAALSHLDADLQSKAAKRYFEKLGLDSRKVLSSWYEDYLRAKREIWRRLPNLALLAGGTTLSIHAMLIYDPEKGVLTTREFMSAENHDSVEVRMESIDSFEDWSNLPKHLRVSMISEIRSWSKQRDLYLEWDHPYLKALKDSKDLIRDLALQMERPHYDATIANEEALKSWAEQEVNEIRYISRKLELENELAEWQRPLHVYIAYVLDHPHPHRIRDGMLARRFYVGDSELFQARQAPGEARESGWVKFEEAFPNINESTKYFLESNSSLINYLGLIMSDPYYT